MKCFYCDSTEIAEMRKPSEWNDFAYPLCHEHSIERPTFCGSCGVETDGKDYCSDECASYEWIDSRTFKKSRPYMPDVRNDGGQSAWVVVEVVGETISNALRLYVFARDKFKCIYCGRTSYKDGVKLELEHIHPKSKGGTNEHSNIVTACNDCNRGKNTTILPSIDLITEEVARRESLVTPTKHGGDTI